MADEKYDQQDVENPDPHFEPLVQLPQIEVATLEEEEEELVKLRAKLFRYDTVSVPPEWKERGTGDMKILQHRATGTCRVLMRRDKTHKVCANHYVLPFMMLKPNCGSERAWVWSTPSDFSDEEQKSELLAVRFANAENAQKFKSAFDDAKKIMEELTLSKSTASSENDKEKETDEKEKDTEAKDKEADSVAEKLEGLKVEDGEGGGGDSNTSSSVENDTQAER